MNQTVILLYLSRYSKGEINLKGQHKQKKKERKHDQYDFKHIFKYIGSSVSTIPLRGKPPILHRLYATVSVLRNNDEI